MLLACRKTWLTHLEGVEDTGQAEAGNIVAVDSLEVEASNRPVEVAVHTGHILDSSPVGAEVGPEEGNEYPVAEWDNEWLEQVGVAVGEVKPLEGVGGVPVDAHLSALEVHTVCNVNNQVNTI